MDTTEYQAEKQKWLPIIRAWQKASGKEKNRLGNELIRVFNRLIEAEAYPYARNFPQHRDDILQAVRLGLIEAAGLWKEEISEEFPHYAKLWMKVELKRLTKSSLQGLLKPDPRLKHSDGSQVRPYAYRLDFYATEDVPLSRTLLQFGIVSENEAVSSLSLSDQRVELTEVLKNLPPRQRHIISERLAGKPRKVIAKERSITNQAISLTEKLALKNIRKLLTKRARSIG